MTIDTVAPPSQMSLSVVVKESVAFTLSYVTDTPDMWGMRMFGDTGILGARVSTISGAEHLDVVVPLRNMDIIAKTIDLTARVPSRSLNVILPES